MKTNSQKRCLNCGKVLSDKQIKFCSRSCNAKFYNKNRTGDKASNWKGGRTQNSEGYWRIHVPDHPKADSTGYVYEHRLVMEEHLGRYLRKGEVVHHKNGNKSDNRIENLQLCESQSEHKKLHNKAHKKIRRRRLAPSPLLLSK